MKPLLATPCSRLRTDTWQVIQVSGPSANRPGPGHPKGASPYNEQAFVSGFPFHAFLALIGKKRSCTAHTSSERGTVLPDPRDALCRCRQQPHTHHRLGSDAGGEVMILKGRVLGPDGSAVGEMRVEIWQCETNGIYLHTRDRNRGGYDEAFQGFGHVTTGSDGAYAFRTIKPAVYPDASHIFTLRSLPRAVS